MIGSGSMTEVERSAEDDILLLKTLTRMGEALLKSGAEIFRVEDTLNRIGYAYGATEMNVFVITSSIYLTMERSGGRPMTITRRIRRSGGTDLEKLDLLNELSRQVCTQPVPSREFEHKLNEILRIHPDSRFTLAGAALAALCFSIFYGGSLADGIAAGVLGIGIWFLQRKLEPISMNAIVFTFSASFLSGLAIVICTSLIRCLHTDLVMIGDIMLLVPGVMLTNSVRDVLLGDTISGSMRFVEAVLLALALVLGFMAAIWLGGKFGL